MSTTNLQPQHLERLLEGGRGLVSKHDPEAVLGQVLEAACEFTGARCAALGILDELIRVPQPLRLREISEHLAPTVFRPSIRRWRRSWASR